MQFSPIPSSTRFLDLTGQQFGRLSVLGYGGTKGKWKFHWWYCRCECGTITTPVTGKLRDGSTTSCGCYGREKTSICNSTHGMSNSSEFRIRASVIRRCYDPKNNAYARYGARGITVCERWLESFENFYADMGPRPSLDHSIDRIDNSGNYEPENCKWSTRIEQGNNKRNNRLIEMGGRVQTVAQWCRELGVEYDTVSRRLNQYKWSVIKSFGLEKCAKERAIEAGLRPGTVHYRLRQGMTLDAALIKPAVYKRKS